MANVTEIAGVRLAAVAAAVPRHATDCAAELAPLVGAERARKIVASTGIRTRRTAASGTTGLDLSLAAAERLLADRRAVRDRIGAVFSAGFASPHRLPGDAAIAQTRLGLPAETLAVDLSLACSGWVQGLYLAALQVRASGRPALLLTGDVQSAVTDPTDATTLAVLSDAGTATLVEPCGDGADPLRFAFLTDGARGAALRFDAGGFLRMDGLAVFRFVAVAVSEFLGDFCNETGTDPAALDAFVPHQANAFMIRALAKSVGVPADRLVSTVEAYGNCAGASIPLSLAARNVRGRTLLAGFGAGLAAAAATVTLPDGCALGVLEV